MQMYTYYFAHCCLRIAGKSDLLDNSSLANFRHKMPHGSTVDLNISSLSNTTCKNPPGAAVGSGVIVGSCDGGGWFFSRDDVEDRCCLAASPDYSRLQGYLDAAQCSAARGLREGFMHLLRIAVECYLACNNGLSVHASCVSFDQQALLFTAPAGTGKSTQAEIWEKYYGARMISGDRPFLRLFENGVRAYGVPWDGKEQIFLQEDYPVLAVVEIRRANSNSISRLHPGQAFRLMLQQCFIPLWDDQVKFFILRTIRLLTQKIPFYRLFCTPDQRAAQLLYKVLFGRQDLFLQREPVGEEQVEMKLKEGFILRNIVGEWVALPAGSSTMDFEGAVVLNEVSAFIWGHLEKTISRDELLQLVLSEYDVDRPTAAADLDEFLGRLKERGMLQAG